MNVSFRTYVSRIVSLLFLVSLLIVVTPVVAVTNVAEFKLLPDDGGGWYGTSVSISGYRALIGAPYQSNRTGAAYIVERQADGSWSEIAKLTASDFEEDDLFGWAVALYENTAVVGAYNKFSGVVYVFERLTDGEWHEVTKLVPSVHSLYGTFGASVSIHKNLILIGDVYGDSYNSFEGTAYIFQRQVDNDWVQIAQLHASDADYGDEFGRSVDLDEGVAIIGASGWDIHGEKKDIGAAYIYEQQANGEWLEVSRLSPGNANPFNAIGNSVAINSNTAVIGGNWWYEYPYEYGPEAAYIYRRDVNGAWLEYETLTASDHIIGDNFGKSVALDGDTIVVGAPGQTAGDIVNAGAAYVFKEDENGVWNELRKLTASDASAGDKLTGLYSQGIAIEKDFILTGAAFDHPYGSAYMFELSIAETEVVLDIKPGSCFNAFNVKSQGVLPVALLGSDTFDVNQTDPGSIRLEGVYPLRMSYEDVMVSNEADADSLECIPSEQDGYLDLIMKFDAQAIAEVLGDVADQEIRTLNLSGALLDGVPITGSDMVVVLNKKKNKK